VCFYDEIVRVLAMNGRRRWLAWERNIGLSPWETIFFASAWYSCPHYIIYALFFFLSFFV
jgi:hypothetical protein